MLTTREISALMKSVATVVREHVGQAFGELAKTVKEMDARWEQRIAAIPAGAKGDKGDRGDPGEPGQAIQGPRGMSAYEVALDKGFVGTQEDWLKSLRGEDGASVDPETVKQMIDSAVAATAPSEEWLKETIAAAVKEAVAAHIATIPVPKDGRDGVDGKDADITHLETQVAELVHEARSTLHEHILKSQSQVLEVVNSIQVPKDGVDGKDGKDADPEQVRQLVQEAAAVLPDLVKEEVAKIPPPKDGRDGRDGTDVHPDEVRHMVEETIQDHLPNLVKTAVDNLPPAKDGKDADPELVKELVEETVGRHFADAVPTVIRAATDTIATQVSDEVARAVSAIPAPKDGVDGKDADPEVIAAMVAKALEDLPKPRDGIDGKSVTIEDVLPLLQHDMQAAIDALPKPKDGVDGKSVSLDDVRPFLESHINGWALDFERRAQDTLQRSIDRMPKPQDGKDGKDGIDGKDGRDGVGFDDLSVDYDGERTVTLKFVKGDVTKDYPLVFPVMIHRDTYRAGNIYKRGDTVTWDGSSWLATVDTGTKPGESKDWRLVVKRGVNGKDGAPGKKGDPGAPGRPGRDLTQMGPDGSKW